MATYTFTTDTNLCDFIDSTSAYDSADGIVINTGAIVTIDRSPASALGNITIDDGQLFIDGANATDPIHVWGLKQKAMTPAGSNGKFVSSVGWYIHSTTGDGTANQTVDWTDYWEGAGNPGDFADMLHGIWMEDTVQVTYTSESGTTPSVGQWVELSGTPTTFGKIHAIDTTAKTIQIEGWAGEITSGTVLEVRTLTDDQGPQVKKTWSATTSGSESLVTDVWTMMARLNSANDAAPTGTFTQQTGQGFLIDEFGTSMTFPYRRPRNGARFRANMITMGTVNSESDFDNDTPRALDGTENNRFDFNGANAGTVESKGICWGSAFPGVNSMGQFEYEYCTMTGAGGNGLGKQMVMEHCIVAPDPRNGYLKGGKLGALDSLAGYKIHDSLLICGETEIASPYQFSTSNNIDIQRCIVRSTDDSSSQDIVALRFTNAKTITIKDNLLGGGVMMSKGVDVDMTTNRMYYSNDDTASENTNTGATMVDVLGGSDNVLIKDLQILNMGAGRLLNVTDSANVTVRCWGSPDYRIAMNTNRNASPLLANGAFETMDWARVYMDSTTGSNANSNRTVQVTRSGYTSTILNIEGCYEGEFEPFTSNLICLGVSGMSDGGINTTKGMEMDMQNIYGNMCFTTFSSATTGNICFSFRDTDAASEDAITTTGGYYFDRRGRLGMYQNSVFEYEMDTFSKGHTGFTGDVTTGTGGSASHGTNPLNASKTLEFQYDIGSGWNGTWLDATVSSNLTGITITPSTGVKLKWKLTQGDAQLREWNGLLFETTTTATDQQTLYPIDQNFVDFALTGLQANSEVRVYLTGTETELFGVENSGTSFTDQYLHTGSDFGVDIIVHHEQYEYIRLENITLTASAASIPIQQQFDRQYNNP